MNLQRKHFDLFVKTFKHWQRLLGLTQYRIDFSFEPLGSSYADINVDELSKTVMVRMSSKMDAEDYRHLDIERCARHEVFHLLTHRLVWLGETRYIENNDLSEEWEAVARRLEGVLKP